MNAQIDESVAELEDIYNIIVYEMYVSEEDTKNVARRKQEEGGVTPETVMEPR